MEPWVLSAWPSWTPGQGGESGGSAPSIADTPAVLQVGELGPLESSEPEGAQSPRPVGDIDPEGTETGLPSPGKQAASSGPSCPALEDEEVEAFSKVRELWRAGSVRWGASHHARQPGNDMQPHCPPLLSWLVCGFVFVTVSPPFFG